MIDKNLFYSVINFVFFVTLTILVEEKIKQFKVIVLVFLFSSILIPFLFYGYAFMKSFLNKRRISITSDDIFLSRSNIIETDLFKDVKNVFFKYSLNFLADLFINILFGLYTIVILGLALFATYQTNHLIQKVVIFFH